MNDLEKTGSYSWIRTDNIVTEYNFKFWSKGMPNDNNGARCTFMLFSDHLPGDDDNGQLGRWTKGSCATRYKFVCQVEPSKFAPKCYGEYEFSEAANKCYRFKWATDDWREGYDKCKDKWHGQLVNVKSAAEQEYITKRIKEKYENEDQKRDWWIGLSDAFTPGSMTWSIGHDQPSYTNWVFGEPDNALANYPPGTACAFISKGAPSDGAWSVVNCGQRDKAYVCQRSVGATCPTGWTLLKTGPNQEDEKCVLFVLNGMESAQWWTAKQYCNSIGARMFLPESQKENDALIKYYSDWERAGVTRLWIGVTSDSDCDFRASNGYPLGYSGWGGDEPNCEKPVNLEAPQCAYLNTLATSDNWKVGNCYERDAFACQVDVGQEISDEPAPASEYYCKQDTAHNEFKFILYEDEIVGHMCYQFLKNAGDTQNVDTNYTTAVDRCATYGATIASVHSAEQNAWMAEHLYNLAFWLGMSNIHGPDVPSK